MMIDISRPREVVATCPTCGMVRRLPLDWQRILERTAQPDWDGQLRCRNTPACGEPLDLREQWNCKYELDGSVIVHFATEDGTHAACDRSELWNVGAARPGTLMRQCQACFWLAFRES
jgi:hypothetical protein